MVRSDRSHWPVWSLTVILTLSLPLDRHCSGHLVTSSTRHYHTSALATHTSLKSPTDNDYEDELNDDTALTSDDAALTSDDAALTSDDALRRVSNNIAHLITKTDIDYKTKYKLLPSNKLESTVFIEHTSPPFMSSKELADEPDYLSREEAGNPYATVDDEATKLWSAGSSLSKRDGGMNPFLRYRLRRYRAFRGSKLLNVWTPRFHTDTFLFGDDDRSVVDPNALRKYPYNNVVRLSTGCTGTLVSPRHVLTAAHCVHNGKESKVIGSLKVDVPGVMGSRIYYAIRAMIPSSWLIGRNGAHRAMNDYAVLELSSSVPGHWHFLQPDWQTDPLDHVIKFYAYPADHYPDLWSSTCFIDGRTGSLLLNRCDASSGTSGATALMRVKSHGMRVIGLVSAVIENDHPGKHFNAITRLTLNKLHVICHMISYPYNRYFCSDLPLSNIDAGSRYIVEYFL